MSNVVWLRPYPRVCPGSVSADDLAVARHLDHLRLRGLAETTVWARWRALVRMQSALPAGLLEASPADLLTWRQGLHQGTDAIVAYLSHARQFYAWCVAEGLIDSSPAVRLPGPARPRRLPRPIGEKALYAAVDAAPGRIRPWLVLAAWCGLRAREIALLRRECVLDTAPQPAILVAADAAKGGRERVVPLSRFALGELRPHLPASGWVFRRLDRYGPVPPSRVSQLSNRHLHECGIPETLHQLRHRFATLAYQASRDLRMVQDLMGHARPETTALYAAWDQGAAAEVLEQLPAPRRLRVVRDA